MAADVIEWGGITKLDLPPDRVLEGAKGKLERVVVLGFTESGDVFFASSGADGGDVIWLMEKAKKALLEVEI
ncbi:hypothetical protein HBA54_27195 [Pelagibius litoralis]|uniref:Uncharacterized protein n=1 Tax=Pelagibius litoralis TaxID=374515 RepID=A0A967KF78_9PROT|nr:hypothetical protein [Pelagibius litoralis]NIA72284.1 hypothetical protein [Pelagibius litoralis]